MKKLLVLFVAAITLFGTFVTVEARDPKDPFKAETEVVLGNTHNTGFYEPAQDGWGRRRRRRWGRRRWGRRRWGGWGWGRRRRWGRRRWGGRRGRRGNRNVNYSHISHR